MKNIVGTVLIITVFSLIKSCDLIDTQEVKGEVVSVIPDLPGSRLGGRLAQPIIRFRFKDSVYTLDDYDVTFFNTYDAGDEVHVYFPKNRPSEAKPYGFVAFWLSIPFLCITGLACMAWIGIANAIDGKVKGYG